MQTPDCPQPAAATLRPIATTPGEGGTFATWSARAAHLLGVSVLASAILFAPAAATADAVAPKPAAPQLSIDIDNGLTATTAGDKLAYTITVSNLGAGSIDNLLVTQSVPAAATFGSAGAEGSHRAGTISWRVKIKPAGKATLRSTMTVKPGTPTELLRLATVSCAHLKPKDPPLVCASDSDLLPAGAAAQAASTRTGSTMSVLSEMRLPWVAGGAGLIAAGLLATVLVRRRRA